MQKTKKTKSKRRSGDVYEGALVHRSGFGVCALQQRGKKTQPPFIFWSSQRTSLSFLFFFKSYIILFYVQYNHLISNELSAELNQRGCD